MNIKQKTLLFALLYFSFSAISQEKTWTNRLELQTSGSFTQSDRYWQPENRPFLDFERQTSINYAIGWNTSFSLNKNISLESGITFMRRKNKVATGFDHCYPNSENLPCASIYYISRDRRHHLVNMPLRIRLQKKISNKIIAYWSNSFNNYLHLSTVYKVSDFKRKDKTKTYHGYSIDTAFGFRYPLVNRCTVDLEVNSRLFEKYKQAEIAYGTPNTFDNSSFKNINLMLSFNYYL